MATTESRTGFRLPWSPDRAPSLDDTGEDRESDPQAGDSGRATSGSGTVDAAEPTANHSEASAPDVASAAPARASGTMGATGADPAHVRRPTKFLIDLTHAMQAAAEDARAATLEQFRVEGSAHVERIKERSIADAEALRRHADGDVTGIKEWSRTEIARIREQAESRIAGRRGQLDAQLARHAALVEQNVALIESQIASFEAEMAAFFDELLAETDVSILAARAQQMPEAPAFGEPDAAAFAALLAEPGSGVPRVVQIAEPQPAARPELVTDVASDAGTPGAASDGAAEPAAGASGFAVTPDGAPEDVTNQDAPARDPRLATLGLTPDFAAAEADAAEAAAAELSEIPELDGDSLAARLAGRFLPAEPVDPLDENPRAAAVSTQVVVTGLVSVASIASFKRHLGRQLGVRHVSVSSGLDGEFLFVVEHETDLSLRDVIPTLPGFGARVTGGGDGVVTATAHDPGD
jgi:hypothetical protein